MPVQPQTQRTAVAVPFRNASPPMTCPSSLTVVAFEPFAVGTGGQGQGQHVVAEHRHRARVGRAA
jgi:hypothetical protein